MTNEPKAGWVKTMWSVLWRPQQPKASFARVLTFLLGLTGIVTAIIGAVGDFPLYGTLSLAGISIIVTELAWENGRRDQLHADTRSLHTDVAGVLTIIQRDVDQVPAAAIHGQLVAMLGEATEWLFRGGSASWIRAEVLPALGQRTERELKFSTVLLDPRDLEVCLKYARYRRQSMDRASSPISNADLSQEIRNSILGLVFALGWYQTHGRIRADVTFTRHFSPVRLDGSQARVMLTVADLRLPALRADAGSWLYSALLDEFRAYFNVGGALTLPESDESIFLHDRDGLGETNVRDALAQTRLEGESALLDQLGALESKDFDAILKSAFPLLGSA
jgi:hypothetical protein